MFTVFSSDGLTHSMIDPILGKEGEKVLQFETTSEVGDIWEALRQDATEGFLGD